MTDNESPYGDDGRGESLIPAIAELLELRFGINSLIPDDGRLSLTFTKSFYRSLSLLAPSLPNCERNEAITLLSQLTSRFIGKLMVVDWGWPSSPMGSPRWMYLSFAVLEFVPGPIYASAEVEKRQVYTWITKTC